MYIYTLWFPVYVYITYLSFMFIFCSFFVDTYKILPLIQMYKRFNFKPMTAYHIHLDLFIYYLDSGYLFRSISCRHWCFLYKMSQHLKTCFTIFKIVYLLDFIQSFLLMTSKRQVKFLTHLSISLIFLAQFFMFSIFLLSGDIETNSGQCVKNSLDIIHINRRSIRN